MQSYGSVVLRAGPVQEPWGLKRFEFCGIKDVRQWIEAKSEGLIGLLRQPQALTSFTADFTLRLHMHH